MQSILVPKCCEEGNVIFVKAHGETLIERQHVEGDESSFSILPDRIKIPDDRYVITVTVPGDSTPFDARVDETIRYLYEEGNTLFNGSDTTNTLTEKGKDLEDYLNREMGTYGSMYKFKNHLPKSKMNNIVIDFNLEGNCNEISCSIDCFDKNKREWYNLSCRPYQTHTTLYDLLKDQGKGIYIIQVCRGVPTVHGGGIPSVVDHYNEVARNISGARPMTDATYKREQERSRKIIDKIKKRERDMYTEIYPAVAEEQRRRVSQSPFIGPKTPSVRDYLTRHGHYERKSRELFPKSMNIPPEERKAMYNRFERNNFTRYTF